MTTTAILKLRSPSLEINLLAGSFSLTGWRSLIGERKDRNLYSSPFFIGDVPRGTTTGNYRTTITTTIVGASQPGVATAIRDLVRLLEDSVLFWTQNWRTAPCVLISRSAGETETRYAEIRNYTVSPVENPFGPAYNQPNGTFVVPNFTIVVEHGPWSTSDVGSPANVPVSTNRQLTGTTHTSGLLDNEDGDCWIGNSFGRTGPYKVKIYDDSAGTYSDVTDCGVAFNAFPDPMGANDALFICAESPQRLPNLRFNITTGAGDDFSIGKGYWNGAAWTTFSASSDGTEGLSVTGSNIMCWDIPSDWASSTIDGDSGYWVRIKISAGGPPPANPLLTVDSIVWNDVYVAAKDIEGDVPAQTKFFFTFLSTTNQTSPGIGRMIVGTRSLPRSKTLAAGESYTGGLFPSMVSLATSMTNRTTVQLTAGITSSEDGLEDYAGARARASSLILDTWRDIVTVQIFATDEPNIWNGTYRAFIRFHQDGGTAGQTALRIGYLADPTVSSNVAPILSGGDYYSRGTSDWELADLGAVRIPPHGMTGPGEYPNFQLVIQGLWTNATPDIVLHDLILMPSDEWFGDLQDSEGNSSIFSDTTLEVDSTVDPRRIAVAVVRDDGVSDASLLNKVATNWQIAANAPPFLQANQAQGIYFIFAELSGNAWLAQPRTFAKVKISKRERFTLVS